MTSPDFTKKLLQEFNKQDKSVWDFWGEPKNEEATRKREQNDSW